MHDVCLFPRLRRSFCHHVRKPPGGRIILVFACHIRPDNVRTTSTQTCRWMRRQVKGIQPNMPDATHSNFRSKGTTNMDAWCPSSALLGMERAPNARGSVMWGMGEELIYIVEHRGKIQKCAVLLLHLNLFVIRYCIANLFIYLFAWVMFHKSVRKGLTEL
jgi:hypothetical protein